MQKKKVKNYRSFFKQFFILLLSLTIIILLSFPLSKKLTKQYKVNDEIKKLEQEIANQESHNLELKKMLEFLNSEEYVEQEARLNLNYKEKGETVLVVRKKKEQKELVDRNLNTNKIAVNENNFVKWRNYFFK